jgi:hypothetical protein
VFLKIPYFFTFASISQKTHPLLLLCSKNWFDKSERKEQTTPESSPATSPESSPETSPESSPETNLAGDFSIVTKLTLPETSPGLSPET